MKTFASHLTTQLEMKVSDLCFLLNISFIIYELFVKQKFRFIDLNM